MGSWGTGPFDNDGAADLIAKLMKPIEIALEPKAQYWAYGDARAACILVATAHGTDILGGPNIQKVLECLQKIRDDEEFIDEWKDPRKIVAALDSDIRKVKRIIAKCEGCKKSAAPAITTQTAQAKITTAERFLGSSIRTRGLVRRAAFARADRPSPFP